METQTHYHPTVVITYLALLTIIIIVGLSKNLKLTLPPDRHADALIKVKPNFFKPDDELEEKVG